MNKKTKPWNLIEERLCEIGLAIMLVILSYQVIMRFVFQHTYAWSEELSRYVFIWFIYLSACVAIYHNAHIKIDALLNIWPRKIRIGVSVLGNLIFFIYAIVVAILGFKYCMTTFAAGSYSTGLHWQMGYVYGCIPVGHAAMAIRLVQLTIKMIKGSGDNEIDKPEVLEL